MRTALTSMLTVAALLAGGACGDDEPTGLQDAGTAQDTSVPDAGRPRSLCPEFADPECSNQTACVEQSDFNGGEFQEVTASCEFCRPFSASVCTFGECELREDLQDTDLLVGGGGATLVVNLGGVASASSVIVGIALQAETAGGESLSCESFRDGSQTLIDNACTNVVEVRTKDVDGVTESHTLSFSRFPGERDVVFLVYAFEQPQAQGEPVGVYCTKQQVPVLPDGETFEVPSEDGFELMSDLRR